MISEFDRDNEWQQRMRDNILVPELYERNYGGRYELLSYIDERANGGCDTIIAGSVRVDEKIVRWPTNEDGSPRESAYDAYTFETMSCSVAGRERAGWMQTNVVDQLLYCFANKEERGLECHVIDFSDLKRWFWSEVDIAGWPLWTSSQINRTQCRIVSFDAVRRAMPVKIFKLFRRSWFDANGRFRHYCHCGAWGDFGVGVVALQGRLGQHFCRRHAGEGGIKLPTPVRQADPVQLPLL